MQQSNRGTLISIEGIDGSGKSTLAKNLYQRLQEQTIDVVLTKEPGSTGLGKLIRAIVHEKKVPITSKAEYLLFAADRAQHFNDVVLPNLEKNKLVISDRMADSSLVYQGLGRRLGTTEIDYINKWAMEQREPDLVFFGNLEPAAAHQQLITRNEELTSFEQEDNSFFTTLADGFKKIFKDRDNVIELDGTLSPEELADVATKKILEFVAHE